jgi:UDP:flavonoid glycosyltransferase YjiC (YdhE family)
MKALLERMTRSGMALYNDLRRREGLPLYRGSMFDMHVEKSRAIFQVGVPGLDYPRSDWPANLQFIGALLPHRSRAREGEGALPADVERKCDRYRSLVVVSQGTTDNRDPEKLFEPSLQALARTEHLVVVTTGGRHTDALRARFAHDNVVVEDWIDFHALLPRASAFLTNGGFGSVLLALSYGVPLLLAGKLEGKADINARVAWAGAGVDLRTERPTPAQIVRGLARVVGNGDEACRIRTGVARVRAELARFDACEIVRAKLEADGVVGGIEARLQRDRMVDAGQDAGQGRA